MDYFYVLGGIEVSVEDRKGFINCLLQRDNEIEIYWDELYDDEMLNEFNVPVGVRKGINSIKLVAHLKAQTRARVAEASFNPECR
jgi:hypothetical protein